MMVVCPECTKPNDADEDVCIHCDADLDDDSDGGLIEISVVEYEGAPIGEFNLWTALAWIGVIVLLLIIGSIGKIWGTVDQLFN